VNVNGVKIKKIKEYKGAKKMDSVNVKTVVVNELKEWNKQRETKKKNKKKKGKTGRERPVPEHARNHKSRKYTLTEDIRGGGRHSPSIKNSPSPKFALANSSWKSALRCLDATAKPAYQKFRN
jgi:hypothetical protein